MNKFYRKLKLFSVLFLLVSVFFGTFSWADEQERDSLLLVVNTSEKIVSIFKADGPSLTLLKTLPVGEKALEVSVSPDGNFAYVTNIKGDSVTVIDLNAFEVVKTITDPRIKGPDGTLVSSDSKTLYVTSVYRNSVVLVSTETYEVLAEIPTGGIAPRRLAFSPDEKQLWVGHNKSLYISVIDLETLVVVRLISVGQEPRGGPAFTKDGKYFLVGNIEDDTVSVIDTQTYQVVRTMGVNLSPQRIEIKHDGEYAYVFCAMEAVFIMPLDFHHDESKRIVLGSDIGGWGMTQSSDGAYLFVSHGKDESIIVVDTETDEVVNTVPGVKDPSGFAYRK